MTVYIKNDMALTEPFSFEDQDKNVIISGRLQSDFDISIKARNVIILGSIVTTKTIKINADQFICAGPIDTFNMKLEVDHAQFGRSDQAIEKIRALGVNLLINPNGSYTVVE